MAEEKQILLKKSFKEKNEQVTQLKEDFKKEGFYFKTYLTNEDGTYAVFTDSKKDASKFGRNVSIVLVLLLLIGGSWLFYEPEVQGEFGVIVLDGEQYPINELSVSDFPYRMNKLRAVTMHGGMSDRKYFKLTLLRRNIKEGYTVSSQSDNQRNASLGIVWEGIGGFDPHYKRDTQFTISLPQLDSSQEQASLTFSGKLINIHKLINDKGDEYLEISANILIKGDHFKNLITTPKKQYDLNFPNAQNYSVYYNETLTLNGRKVLNSFITAPTLHNTTETEQRKETAMKAAYEISQQNKDVQVSQVFLEVSDKMIESGYELAVVYYAPDDEGLTGGEERTWQVKASTTPWTEEEIKIIELYHLAEEQIKSEYNLEKVNKLRLEKLLVEQFNLDKQFLSNVVEKAGAIHHY